ncbi:DNA methyltransferase [Streptomyces sp. NPDC047042]|uniref:class I SAM-dependent DNA methyltransferase n=1 Tax=Streptomyces sp. NPDC047042 TaxID=3154807 RepID=UPI0033F7ACDD
MTDSLIARAEQHNYQKLFIHDLNWSRPDHPPIAYEEDGHVLTATNVSSYKGLRVWVCDQKPGSKLEAALDHLIAGTSTDRLVIFYDGSEQVWRWPVRRATGASTATRLSRHLHRTGDRNPQFAAKLEAIRLPLDAALDPNAVLAKVRSAFDVEAHNETKHASKLMARMYTAMEQAYPAGYDRKSRDHEISVTLARLLFLMFGDDTEMWPQNLFRDYIHQHTSPDGSDIGTRLSDLFAYLDTPPVEREKAQAEFMGFRYVNGGIFRERLTLPTINAEFRTVILEACERDWAAISPAIFGSMFQSVRDAKTRRELGEHYTSEENILKTLNPLFLDELRAEFEHIKTLGKYEADRLRKLRDKLGKIRYMDPACGCGNFIIVAYRELRDLELAIMERLQEITRDDPMLLANLGLRVTLDHFYGIEIDEWPARIAETAMFLIDRQCDLKLTERLGWAPDRLPIQEHATIRSGVSALRLDWAAVCPPSEHVVVAGNPPFLGDHTRTPEQLAELRVVWGGNKTLSRMDYVTGWHAKALQYFAHHDGVWAFVTTNSITQGDQVHRLFSEIFNARWLIKFAHRTFAWTSEAVGAAAVHCVIIGFARQLAQKPRLFDYASLRAAPEERTVSAINAYLVDGPNVLVDKRTSPISVNLPEVAKGSMPTDGGNLVVTPEVYETVAADPIAARFLRPYVGSKELIGGRKRWCLWLVNATPSDLARSPELRRRIAAVRETRQASTAATTRSYQHDHLFRQFGITPDTHFVCIPEVSSENRDYLPVGYLDAGTIISNKVYGAVDPSGLVFAVASSRMFLAWMLTVGGRLKSDPSFSSTITWNNFPLPALDAASKGRIVAAGREIIEARKIEPSWSLEDHYRPSRMHHKVRRAHEELDSLIDRVFGIRSKNPHLLERQEALFANYLMLTAPLTSAAGRRRRGRLS